VRLLQRRVASTFNGPLDRPDWWWEWRRPRHRDERRHSYAWVQDGAVTGFMLFRQDRSAVRASAFDLVVTELWTETADALHGLLGSLGSHATMTPAVRFQDSTLPPIPEITWAIDAEHHRFTMTTREPWMLRLVDAGSAMAQRGWRDDVHGEVHLELQDPLHRSTRRVVLEVEGGTARTRPGGEGRVVLGIGPLATWYAGGLTASRLARLGMIRGDAADLAVMDRLAADLPAWLPDHF
jgi:predicted acetyltransferase